jgi:membrane protein
LFGLMMLNPDLTTHPRSEAPDQPTRPSAKEMVAAAWRSVRSAGEDDFGMVASSIAFSSFLALLPSLALVALVYGSFTDPEQVVADLRTLVGIMPSDARGSIDQWLGEALLRREGRGFGLIASLALLVYSASRAGRSLLYGLNVAYRVDRRRGFFARRLTSVVIVLMAAAFITCALAAVSAFAFVSRFLPELPFETVIAQTLFWSAAGSSAFLGLGAIYRFGPAEPPSTWRDVAPGAGVATLMWLCVTGLFSFYLTQFDGLGRVYGSIGAVMFLQFWLLASAMSFLLGARFNAELAETVLD